MCKVLPPATGITNLAKYRPNLDAVCWNMSKKATRSRPMSSTGGLNKAELIMPPVSQAPAPTACGCLR